MCTDSVAFQGSRQSMEESLVQLKEAAASYGTGGILPGAVDGKLSSAIPVNPDRVAIPQKAGTVDPLSWLPEDRREVVANLPAQRLPEGLWDEVVPGCHRVPKREEARLVRKLLAQGMITLVAERELPRTNRGKLLTGGFFCVKKSDVEDRLIYDRRPENATMSRLGWSQLPSGACLTRILLAPDEF